MQDTKIDIERELERINQDVDDAEAAGIKRVFAEFFCGAENEREFICAAKAAMAARGYACTYEYEDGELVLIIRKAA